MYIYICIYIYALTLAQKLEGGENLGFGGRGGVEEHWVGRLCQHVVHLPCAPIIIFWKTQRFADVPGKKNWTRRTKLGRDGLR